MSWNDLSMKDRASYIKLGIENGITDLDTIRGIYNKFALGGDTKDSSKYMYADSDTTDPNFTDLTPIAPGVYKNKYGKLVYARDEMPSTEEGLIDKTKRGLSEIDDATVGNILEFVRRIVHKGKDIPFYKSDPEYYKNRVRSGGTAQRVYLLPRWEQEQIFLRDGYLRGKEGDYGLVRKAVGDRDIPVWQTAKDAEVRENLFHIGNDYYSGLGSPERLKDLVHAGNFPSAYYVDSNLDKLYVKSWDLNDYGGGTGASSSYKGVKKVLSNLLDKAGNPVVVTTGYQPVVDSSIYGEQKELRVNDLFSKDLSNYPTWSSGLGDLLDAAMSKRGLVRTNIGTETAPNWKYTLPEAVIDSERKKSLGGNLFAEGGPLKKSYKDFSTRLSKAWGNQDLSQDDYDYQKYYNDDPDRAYRQLESIEKGGEGHFDDGGKSGIYKTPNHATYPDLGPNSWLNNDRIFNMSARQAVPENTDRVLDYLGYDLGYNKGGTKAMYNGAYQLPEVTITPNGNYTELIPNELGTGWMYRDRAGRFDDFNYDYVNRYERNQKALGGNLFADGGKKATRYRSSSNIRKQISTWEGSTMRTNVPFDRMDTMFNQVLPEGALEKLSQEQLDGLYSFAYNVGTGRFKTRTAPTLAKYLQGNATIEDVKGTMWASGDKKYRGLANRRKKERSMLGAYVPVQETIPMTTPLATPLDITPAVQPIIESNPVIQDNIETLPLAFNTESQKESYYTPGFFDYVNYINQIRQPKQRDRRIWLTI